MKSFFELFSVYLVGFFIGIFVGISWERSETSEYIANINKNCLFLPKPAQSSSLYVPYTAPSVSPPTSKKIKKEDNQKEESHEILYPTGGVMNYAITHPNNGLGLPYP